MSRTETASVDARTREHDLEFGAYYYAHDCGAPYERNEFWLGFFRKMAERIQSDLAPTTVLDAGCAFGMLVEELRALGVEAFGIDVSDYAISQVGESVQPYCRQASLTEPIPDRYDLITCIEVLEHIPPAEAEQAIANLCATSDRILLSSSPFDYGEPTHVNIRPPEDWAASFAKHGFVIDLDVDVSFVTEWAVLFTRERGFLPDVVRSYERSRVRLSQEIRELRQSVLDLQNRLESGRVADLDVGAREELLAVRDQLIGTEAQLGEALGRVRELDSELSRYRIAADRLDEFTRSPVWRYYEPYRTLRAKIGSRARALLGRLQ